MSDSSVQLLLGLNVADGLSFDNFVNPEGSAIVERLRRSVFQNSEWFVYIVGAPDSGKSHLCVSLLNEASNRKISVHYIACKELLTHISESDFQAYVDVLVSYDLLILDDIEVLAGQEGYELVLFELFNQIKDRGTQLVVSARDIPARHNYLLKDLVSRLQSGLVLSVEPLSEQEKKAALVAKARERGMRLSEELVNYIYARSARNFGALLALLDQLDHAQLIEKRSLTVPFVKKVLGW